MRSTHRRPARSLVGATIVVLPLAPAVLGQDVTPEMAAERDEIPPAAKGTEWYFAGGAAYQFGNGSFDSVRARLDLGFNSRLSDGVSLVMGLAYDYSNYDFKNSDVGDPWSDVHRVSLAGILSFELTDSWGTFVGGFVENAHQGSLDFNNSVTGGGLGGVTYKFSPDLLVGGGFGVSSKLGSGMRVFPVIVIDWDITADLRLTTRAAAGTAGRGGAELIYDVGQSTELALGSRYRFLRFRLDEGGVGEDTGWPVWLRLTHRFTPNFSLTGTIGILLDGKLVYEPDSAPKLKDDYGVAGFVGISGRFRF